MMRYALLLSGGAAFGANQVETIERLHDAHGPPALVVGTSVGATHAVKVAQDRPRGLRDLWNSVESSRWFMKHNPDVWNGLNELGPLRKKVLAELLSGPLVLPAYVGVVNLETLGHELLHLNPLGAPEAAAAVIASSTMPLVHQAHSKYVDGGVACVLPPLPDELAPSSFDEIHAVFAGPIGRDRIEFSPFKTGLGWVGGRALTAFINAAVQNDLERLSEYARTTKVFLYAPEDPGGDHLNADRAVVQHRLNHVGKEVWASRRQLGVR